MLKEERLAGVHATALLQFDEIQTAMREERERCLSDRRFYSIEGAQWEGAIGEQFENKPKMEVNKVHLALLRIVSEYRNNRITVKFISKDGTKDLALADVCAGLFRADEHDSTAEEAYDNAFEEAAGGGFGALRLRAVYEDEEDPDNEQQRIRIEPIYDADISVFFDLDAKRQDKADATFCFVVMSMTPDKYKATYDDDPATWDRAITGTQFDWAPPDVVYVAEYYCIEDKGDTRLIYKGIAGDEVTLLASELKDDPTKESDLEAQGYTFDRKRRFKASKVHKYIMSGNNILSDEGYIAGKCIPIVPNYGKRWFVDNIERCMGHVRLAKDAQRLKNMQLSKLAELSAQSGVEKPILIPEQIAGHEDLWSDDVIKNYPYLLINSITGADGNPMPAAPVAYTHAPNIPPSLAALLSLTDTDIRDLLGTPQEDMVVSNIAEDTLLSMQTRMDMQTYIYVSNFAKAIRRVGEVWLSMASELYVEEGRKMKTIDDTEAPDTVVLGTPINDPNTGALSKAADLTKRSFDVTVDVGPSSVSKRQATVKTLTGMLQATQATQDPETAQVLMSMAIMNMEGEGISDVRDFFRQKLIKMGVIKPNEDEAKAMAAQAQAAATQGPSAQDLALRGMAEESQAKATKARADVLQTMADVEKTHAQTMEILANVDMTTAEKAVALMQQFGNGGLESPGSIPGDTHRPAMVGDREAILSAKAGVANPQVAQAVDQANSSVLPSYKDGKSIDQVVEANQEYYREAHRQRGDWVRQAGDEHKSPYDVPLPASFKPLDLQYVPTVDQHDKK